MNTTQAIGITDRYIRSKQPLIGIVTHEETRVIKAVKTFIAGQRPDLRGWTPRQIVEWSVMSGLVVTTAENPINLLEYGIDGENSINNPVQAIRDLLAFPTQPANTGAPMPPPLFVFFKDMHPFLENPLVVRALRELAYHFSSGKHTAFFISPSLTVPPELDKMLVLVDWPLPDADELAAILNGIEQNLPPHTPSTLNGGREKVVQALLGLTAFEAQSVLLNAVAAKRALSDDVIELIVKEKSQIIRRSGALEFYETNVTDAQVGGLKNWKEYAARKRRTFSNKAKAFGLRPAKGVTLVGIPGTGKSLSAKAFAGGEMPLLRLDIGSLIGGIQGVSEANMRAALKVAEAVAPCVLWIDEVEKALSGIQSSAQTDGGVFARMFGYLLTWMEEKTSPVYVFATANKIMDLPPEFLRRFDDTFFVDLPNLADRKEIFAVQIRKVGRDPELFDLDVLAETTWSYTGAEIEKVVVTGLEMAFMDETELTTEHVLRAVPDVTPIVTTMQAQIEESRAWAAGRVKYAGEPLEPQQRRQIVATTADRMLDEI